MSRIHRTFAAAVVAAFLAGAVATPAFASDASDAYKEAKAKKDAVKKAGNDEAKRQTAEQELADYCKGKAETLAAQKATMLRTDLMYLGWLKFWAGDKQGGIATVREAVDSKAETKFASSIHANLVNILIDNGEPDGAAIEAQKMIDLYADSKEAKLAAMNLGMAYRAQLNHEKAAKWLQTTFDMGETNATKPLVNSLLLAGKKDAAVAAAKAAVEKGIPQQKEDMQVLVDITEKIGTDVSGLLKFDGFVPSGEPELKGKVVVLAFWNVSARTFKWSLRLLDGVKKGYGEAVTCIAATTYLKKNPETGKIEDTMSPEVERSFGAKLADQESWRGWMGYLPDEAAQRALGVAALPHVVVVGKDGTLLFAHTMNVADGTDTKILGKILDQATGQ